jgi:hypothetical protein
MEPVVEEGADAIAATNAQHSASLDHDSDVAVQDGEPQVDEANGGEDLSVSAYPTAAAPAEGLDSGEDSEPASDAGTTDPVVDADNKEAEDTQGSGQLDHVTETAVQDGKPQEDKTDGEHNPAVADSEENDSTALAAPEVVDDAATAAMATDGSGEASEAELGEVSEPASDAGTTGPVFDADNEETEDTQGSGQLDHVTETAVQDGKRLEGIANGEPNPEVADSEGNDSTALAAPEAVVNAATAATATEDSGEPSEAELGEVSEPAPDAGTADPVVDADNEEAEDTQGSGQLDHVTETAVLTDPQEDKTNGEHNPAVADSEEKHSTAFATPVAVAGAATAAMATDGSGEDSEAESGVDSSAADAADSTSAGASEAAPDSASVHEIPNPLDILSKGMGDHGVSVVFKQRMPDGSLEDTKEQHLHLLKTRTNIATMAQALQNVTQVRAERLHLSQYYSSRLDVACISLIVERDIDRTNDWNGQFLPRTQAMIYMQRRNLPKHLRSMWSA